MLEKYVKRILQSHVYDVAVETPIHPAMLLSKRINNKVLLKREDLQPVYSFKIRGAYNKIACLSEADQQRGVVTASAGNHAQGVALAAKKKSIKAVIVMPQTTPEIKIRSVKQHSAKVVLSGDTFDEAYKHARELEDEHGYVFVHPYDDPDVIAGQGTVGMEILNQCPAGLDAIFVPVGGGGLLAGVAAYVKYLRPEIKVIAVEAEDSACLNAAMEKKRRVTLPQVGIFADGVAVAQIGKEPFKIVKDLIDGVVTVTTDEICSAIKDIFEDTRSITEPSGALALAGLKKYTAANKLEGQTLLAIDSGANVNFDRLRHISERTELGERREAILAVEIHEKPGSFQSFCQALGRRNISEFNYRYHDKSQANVFVGVQLNSNESDVTDLVSTLSNKGYGVEDLSGDEMAKLHIRYMVGGHKPDTEVNELLFRFEFPERPGALMKFLSALGARWNISLFHYRNHGAAYGRVLVGFQADKRERKQVIAFLEQMSYRYWDETDNGAYRLFLS